MSSLPFPLRLAAGLVAAGIDTVRTLPAELPALGVRLAGSAAKLALQVRNEITELAIRGDELLDGSPTVQEKPAWATFDDDDEPAPTPRPTRGRASKVPGGGLGGDTPTIGAETPGWSDPLTDAASDTTPGDAAGTIIPGYASLTLGQLRSRLTPLALPELRALLGAEELHAQRPAFLTLISNRIATLERTGS